MLDKDYKWPIGIESQINRSINRIFRLGFGGRPWRSVHSGGDSKIEKIWKMESFWVQTTANSTPKLILIQGKFSLLDLPIAQEFKKFWKSFLIRQDFDQSVWTRLALIALQMKHYLFIQHCQILFQDVPSGIRLSCYAIHKKLSGTRIKLYSKWNRPDSNFWLHRCWWRMLETRFECWWQVTWPIGMSPTCRKMSPAYFCHQHLKMVTIIKSRT